MLIVPYADHQEWLAARQSGIGASEAAQALGLEPSPLAVYNRKLGLEPKGPPTIPQEVGLALEPLVLRYYERETGRKVVQSQTLVRSRDHPFMLATLDGLDDAGDIVEAKTITPRRLRELGDTDLEQIPDEWNVQTQQQMAVTEKDRATVAVLIGNEAFRLYGLQRNQRLIDHIIRAEAELWDRIQSRRPPAAMEDDDYATVVRAYEKFSGAIQPPKDILQLIQQIYFLGKVGSAIDKARESLRVRLAEWMGDASAAVAPDGWGVTRSRISKASYVVKASEYTQLNIKTPKGMKDGGESVQRISADILARLEINPGTEQRERHQIQSSGDSQG